MRYTLDEIQRMLIHAQPHEDLEGNILYLSSTMKQIVTELVGKVKQLQGDITHILSHLDDANEGLTAAREDLREINEIS